MGLHSQQAKRGLLWESNSLRGETHLGRLRPLDRARETSAFGKGRHQLSI